MLSDPQKRAIFDQHGPEDGKSSGVNYDRASPMGAQGFGGGMHGMNGFGEEISPEELFNMFFGGGNFGGCKYLFPFRVLRRHWLEPVSAMNCWLAS